MEFHNLTTFPHQVFQTLDLDGVPHWVCVLKVGCNFDDTSKWDANEKIELVDSYTSEDSVASISKPSDIAPFKPNGELLLLNATAKSITPRPTWKVRIKTDGIDYSFNVSGKRFWRKSALGIWSLSRPEPTTAVDLSFENSYGGMRGDVAFGPNPVGRGFNWGPGVVEVEAPQVFAENELPSCPSDVIESVGVGPLAPAWSTRLAYAGTFDAVWEERRKPLLPRDFSFEFYNYAPLSMRKRGYFRGDETIEISGLEVNRSQLFKLPGPIQPCMLMRLERLKYAIAELHLDTVLLNFQTRRVSAVLRACAIIPNTVSRVDILPAHPAELTNYA